MDRTEADPIARPTDSTLASRGGLAASSEVPKLWRPPPAPAFLSVFAVAIFVVTLFGAPFLLWANGQEADVALVETFLILAGEAVVLWFVFAIRCAYLESMYAPTQRYYRKRLLIGFIVLVAVIVILFLLMGRSSKNSNDNS